MEEESLESTVEEVHQESGPLNLMVFAAGCALYIAVGQGLPSDESLVLLEVANVLAGVVGFTYLQGREYSVLKSLSIVNVAAGLSVGTGYLVEEYTSPLVSYLS